jgi:signal transduction histidine kinase
MRNPVVFYVRARLQRRMFWWFGLAILATIATVMGVNHVLGGGPATSWQQEVRRVRSFVGARFATVWNDPPARDELARGMAQELELDIAVVDTSGQVLVQSGARCRHPMTADVKRGHVLLGRVEACGERTRAGAAWRVALAFCAAGLVLWMASGAVARRLSRPYFELARVAQDLGNGKLSSRVRLGNHSHGEVAVLGAVLNDMASRIERQIADQRALLATVSHEIRTPLARMRLLTEMAHTDPGALEQIDREVAEIDDLVAELLAGSRLDFSALTVKDLDVAEIATSAVERAGVDPTVMNVEATIRTVRGDPTLLSRAVSNLLENAKRHAGGVECLRVSSRPGFVSFEVDDEGPGFPAGEEDRLFEPFFRGPTTDGRSVGLGLALVKRIAEAHGGKAYAKNREGKGARIGFEIAA